MVGARLHSDQDLLSRSRLLERQALAEVYDRFSPGLYRYALRLLGNADLAEECVAETFSRFLRALHRGGGPRQHLRAYLYRVAHNWVTDAYRGQPLLPLPEEATIHDSTSPSPAETVARQLEGERMRAALIRLTPPQRQVLILKFLEGWGNREVALALQKPVGAIKSLQHRALAALRRALTVQQEREP